MTLSGAQYKQIQEALLAAFNEADLRRMVRIQLDADLDAVSGGKNLSERVYSLIEWADREGRVLALIDGATAQNSGNAKLQALKVVATDWHLEPAEAGEPPYQGLQYFDVKDADRFFGREKLTAELVGYLHHHRLLAVIGASGSGKSSVVRAGMVPALQGGKSLVDSSLPPKNSDRWLVHILTPTARPLESLATQLVPKGSRLTAITDLMDDLADDDRCLHLYIRQLLADDKEHDHLLLVVDQFEELFTLCKDKDEQRAFVDNLLTAASPDGVTIVILTLRADFYAHCSDFANLRAALESSQRYIGAMSQAELRTAIEAPAEQGGWGLEPGLTDEMLDDMAGEPGALPLLSHALLETWKGRSGRMLTFAGYRAAGGVKGAIAHTADLVYGELSPDEQAIARNIFLRLTELGEGVQDTRRRVPLSELVPENDTASVVEKVLTRLQDERLVTAEREYTVGHGDAEATEAPIYVDVTHEALIREWPALRDWLAEDREGLRTHRKLTDSVIEWERLKRDPSVLYRGLRLEQTMAWVANHRKNLNGKEQEFLDASREKINAEESTERDRKRSLLIGAVVIIVVLTAGIAFFIRQSQQLDAKNRQLEVANQLAQAELKRQEGLGLVQDAIQLASTGRFTEAMTTYAMAIAADPTIPIDAEAAITGTVRTTATSLVQEGERILRETSMQSAAQNIPVTPRIAIQTDYLMWAKTTAPQLVGWSPELPQIRQQAIISATALFSQALALNPPPDTPVYVWIEGGAFLMGTTEEQCDQAGLMPDCPSDEQPATRVSVDGFWLQRTEVTNQQYRSCVDAGVCTHFGSPGWDRAENAMLPVAYTTWNEANDYAKWVGGRLPTEVEWEFACRGPNSNIYPWGDRRPSEQLLNYWPTGYGREISVGSFPAGFNGLYDMSGNVYEWTSDIYRESYFGREVDADHPTTPAEDVHALRSSSYYSDSSLVFDARCAMRSWRDSPHFSSALFGDIGFRVAISAN